MSTGARAHCWLGRAMPVLAAASSGVGERKGGVKGVGTVIVARFGKAWHGGKRAHAKQGTRRHPERVD